MNEKNQASNFKIVETGFEGLYVVEIFCRHDNRGSFEKDYAEFIIDNLKLELKEIFYTKSKKNVIRANHFQIIKPQSKYVRCLSGKILDVVVDLRKDSKTYKRYFKIELTGDCNKGLFIPIGFSHGYLVKEDAIVSYKCDEFFLSDGDTGFKWNDPEIAIDWEIDEHNVILSKKDEELPALEAIIKQLDF